MSVRVTINGKGQAGYQGPTDLRADNGMPLSGDALVRELIYELRALRAEFAEWSTPPVFHAPEINVTLPVDPDQVLESFTGSVALREADVLPDDFPARDLLAAAGIVYVEDLSERLTMAQLVEIDGIGPATASKIMAEAEGIA